MIQHLRHMMWQFRFWMAESEFWPSRDGVEPSLIVKRFDGGLYVMEVIDGGK